MNGVSSRDIRERNVIAVMQAVRRGGTPSRGELAAATGLDRSTLTHITGALLDAGLIEVSERAPASSRGGRRAELLRLSRLRYAVAGCDIRSGGARWVLMSLDGTPIDHGTVGPSMPTASLSARSAWLEGVMDDVRSAIAESATHHQPAPFVVGTGMALPALVDRTQQTLVESFELGLARVDLHAAWRSSDHPVLFDNDASCYTWREIATQGPSTDGIYAYTKFHRDGPRFTDTGLGVGVMLVTDGRIRRGAHGSAGELRGYAWAPGRNQLGVAMEELRQDQGEEAAVMAASRELVRNLTVLASVLDPSRVIIAGDLCSHEAALTAALTSDGDQLRNLVELRPPSPLELAEGAAWMVAEQLFAEVSPDPRLSFSALLG